MLLIAGFVIEPILEELPKWRLVCKIMQELQAEGKFSQSANGESTALYTHVHMTFVTPR